MNVNKFLLANTKIFIGALIITDLLILKIPFQNLFEFWYSTEVSKNLSRITHGVILVIIWMVFIRKFAFDDLAGAKLFSIKNPLYLFLPFIYPMSLSLFSISNLEVTQTNMGPMVLGFMGVVSKAMSEEIGFRGLLQAYLLKKYSDKISNLKIVCFTALIFALMHIINLTRYSFVDVINQIIGAFFFGVFFGALLLKTKNIFILGFIHGLINFSFSASRLYGDKKNAHVTYVDSISEVLRSILIYSVVFLPLLILGLFILSRCDRKKNSSN